MVRLLLISCLGIDCCLQAEWLRILTQKAVKDAQQILMQVFVLHRVANNLVENSLEAVDYQHSLFFIRKRVVLWQLRKLQSSKLESELYRDQRGGSLQPSGKLGTH